jgi:hypothetical protein
MPVRPHARAAWLYFFWFFLKGIRAALERGASDAFGKPRTMSALRVAVPAISFCQHAGPVERLRELYPDAKVNNEGAPYYRSEGETIAYLEGYDAAIVSFEPINEGTFRFSALSSTERRGRLACDRLRGNADFPLFGRATLTYGRERAA